MKVPYPVVEITSTYAGAYAGRQLAEAGLPVLRVELTDATPLQKLPPFAASGDSVAWLSANGKKENLRIDAGTEEGRSLLEGLIARSAVFLTDDPDWFEARSRLMTCHMRMNPMSIHHDLPTDDVLVQAMSGALSMTGRPGESPVPIGIPLGDVAPGIYAAIGIMNGLLSDESRVIAVHGLDATASLLSYLGCSYLISGEEPGLIGSGHPHVVPYGAYRAKDGYIIVAPGFTQAFWRKLCRMLDKAELIDDPRFLTPVDRRNNREELQAIFRPAFTTRTVEDWAARLDEADVPSGPYRTFARALQQPLVQERGMVTRVGEHSFLATPLRCNTAEEPGRERPTPGTPWRQIMQDLGVPAAGIDALTAQGTVKPRLTPFSPAEEV